MIVAGIIPEAAFVDVPLLWLCLIGVAGIVLLVVGADRAVHSAAKLAAVLGMSKVLIGATVVSLGTTSPEAAVSVNAALGGDGNLALGNGVGSIITDTALIFGLSCCLVRLPKNKFVLNRHGWLQLGAGALLFAIVLGLWARAGSIHAIEIPRSVGVVLLALLVGYLAVSVHWARQRPEIVPAEAAAMMRANHKAGRLLGNLAVLAVGLAMVVGGSELLVGSARTICERYKVPQAVISATVVAFGTSLPELATAIAAIVKKHPDLLVGNVIGADILNVLFVVGASAAAVPLKVDPLFIYFILPVMMLVLVMLRIYIFADNDKFRRWHGVPLLAIYVIFVAGLLIWAPHPAK